VCGAQSFLIADLIKYAATPPNQPQRSILTGYFNNYNLASSNNALPDDGD